jgi:hypothetical protein
MTDASKSLQSPAERATALFSEYRTVRSWRKLARKYDVPAGTLCRFARSSGEYAPRKYARVLGIQIQVMRPAPACPECGQVHVREKCTRRKPLPEWVSRAADFLAERESQTRPLQACARNGRKVAK